MSAPFSPSSSCAFGRVVDRVAHDGLPSEFEPGDLLTVPRRILAYHMAIIGRTGMGKSRFVAGLIQRDIEDGVPLILLDGVGASYEDTLSFLATKLLAMELELRRAPPALRPWLRRRMKRFVRRFVLLDLTRQDPRWRINVLRVSKRLRREEIVAAVLGACMRATEGDPETTRQLVQVIRAVLTLLVELGDTVLRDALDILALQDSDWEALLSFLERKRSQANHGAQVRESAALKFLRDFFFDLPPAQRQMIARSTWNMLNLFLGDPIVAKLLSCKDTTLDFDPILAGEKSLLIKLPPGQDILTQRLVGSLLLDVIMLLASKRDLQAVATGKLPRITLYIDEVAAFAGRSFTQDLTRCRNWGVAVCATFQHFKQNPWHTVEGQALHQGMRGNMGSTVMFRVGMDMALAEAEGMFRPSGDLVSRVVEEITDSAGSSEAHGWNTSQSTTTTLSSSASEGTGEMSGSSSGTTSDWETIGGSSSFGNSRSDSRQSSTSEGISDSSGWTRGTSRQSSVTTSRSRKVREDFYTVEEQTRILAHALASTPPREAYVMLGNDRAETYRIRTLDVRVEWDTVWGGKDYKEEFFEMAAPEDAAVEVAEPLDVRVRRLVSEERRRNRDIQYPPPRVVVGGRR